MAVPLPTGGYECEFVEAVPDSLFCPVCLLPFRDPHLLDCCGAKYCAVCIGRVKAANQPCPLCKQQFTTMLDKNDRRKVLSLMVRCSRKKDGCDWEGELRHLEHHQMEECGWVLVKCCYECGVCVPRPQLVEHELHLCPKRVNLKVLESAMIKMEERHKKEMEAVKEEFRREMVAVKEELKRKKEQEIASVKNELQLEIKMIELQVEDMIEELKKMKNNQELAKMKLEFRRQEQKYTSKMNAVEESLVKLTEEMRVHLSLPPCELVMTEYSKHKSNDDTWYSPPFYTGPGGYKMCLRVYANGCKDGAGTHVSVYVYLIRGEHDDKLTWPFLGDITIQLINQNNDQDLFEKNINFTNENLAVANEISGLVISGERAKCAWGYSKFFPHTMFAAGANQYLKNDCIKFRVTKIVVHSV